jgi:hypothetical protein
MTLARRALIGYMSHIAMFVEARTMSMGCCQEIPLLLVGCDWLLLSHDIKILCSVRLPFYRERTLQVVRAGEFE